MNKKWKKISIFCLSDYACSWKTIETRQYLTNKRIWAIHIVKKLTKYVCNFQKCKNPWVMLYLKPIFFEPISMWNCLLIRLFVAMFWENIQVLKRMYSLRLKIHIRWEHQNRFVYVSITDKPRITLINLFWNTR